MQSIGASVHLVLPQALTIQMFHNRSSERVRSAGKMVCEFLIVSVKNRDRIFGLTISMTSAGFLTDAARLDLRRVTSLTYHPSIYRDACARSLHYAAPSCSITSALLAGLLVVHYCTAPNVHLCISLVNL